ncbi:hypothetical protein CKM354_001206400 [Cercospora kikuchii]|uniref:Uncharacterized protein n=1 Tax=Cercospora kikuchii TaxID=84275 RepID=A0A9P3FIN6_9PEZI|nr:uncharacterized protein CKM354_001206400 [Cercospora kikuchii]GIZ49023.1 hypothetical protein CKM354_001206400 [Cercospora kikuchii]
MGFPNEFLLDGTHNMAMPPAGGHDGFAEYQYDATHVGAPLFPDEQSTGIATSPNNEALNSMQPVNDKQSSNRKDALIGKEPLNGEQGFSGERGPIDKKASSGDGPTASVEYAASTRQANANEGPFSAEKAAVGERKASKPPSDVNGATGAKGLTMAGHEQTKSPGAEGSNVSKPSGEENCVKPEQGHQQAAAGSVHDEHDEDKEEQRPQVGFRMETKPYDELTAQEQMDLGTRSTSKSLEELEEPSAKAPLWPVLNRQTTSRPTQADVDALIKE